MKRTILTLSLAANAALLASLAWVQQDHVDEVRDLRRQIVSLDRTHLGLHASSLSALEDRDPETVDRTLDVLSQLVATARRNGHLEERTPR